MLDYHKTIRQINREVRAELFDNGLYSLIHTPLDELSPDLAKEWCHMKALQVNRWKRINRLKQNVADILAHPKSLFLTLTFTDEVLARTSAATRRKYVARVLGAFKVPYIANLDYGQDDRYTKREHYHALIAIDRIDRQVWSYGNMDFKRTYNKNGKRISRYITKLTYHAIKIPVRLIYGKPN